MSHARALKENEVPPDREALRRFLGNCGIPAHELCPYCDKAIDKFLANAAADTKRLDIAQGLLLGADFEWGEPPTRAVILELPSGVRIGADLRQFLDAVAAQTPKQKEVAADDGNAARD